MSEYAINIEGASKKFRRFAHPGWRALDALGFAIPTSKYDELLVLQNIDVSIRRGEKVALIGRNGAGKSTLLRLISGQILPDKGKVVICGSIQALMELGTGFHPDFSGIDNIRAALAYQGVTPVEANKFVDEIIDFTELDGFIDRPIREYSAGMYARLAFAVSTAVKPDILIIDEILGAGDAYFIGKSIQRMKELTSHGATVLFVSHDMSAAQLLCERALWIEHGVIKGDGNILTVSKTYLASIREEEEVRARIRSMQLTKNHIVNKLGNPDVHIYRLIGVNGQAPLEFSCIAEIRYGCKQKSYTKVLPDSSQTSRMILEPGYTNWSNIEIIDGKQCRRFGDFGGEYVHAPWQIDWLGYDKNGRWMEIDCKPSRSDDLVIELYSDPDKKYIKIAGIPKAHDNDNWLTVRVDLEVLPQDAELQNTTNALDLQYLQANDRYGSGPIKINAFAFFDQNNERHHTLISGECCKAVMSYTAKSPVDNPVAVIAIYRPDGTCALQVTSNRNHMELGVLEGRGQITALFSPLLLGPGDYIVSVALFKELNIGSNYEPEAYDVHDRCYALKIMPPTGVGVEIGIINQPTQWEILT